MEKNKMKISKARLKQIIREELQTVLSEVDKNFVYYLVKKAKPWLPGRWNSVEEEWEGWPQELIIKDPFAAWSELMRRVIEQWTGTLAPGLTQAQNKALNSGRAKDKIEEFRAKTLAADAGKFKDAGAAFDDLRYFVPDAKGVDAAMATQFAKEFIPPETEEDYFYDPDDDDL